MRCDERLEKAKAAYDLNPTEENFKALVIEKAIYDMCNMIIH